jgi:Uma2 family endonuclease
MVGARRVHGRVLSNLALELGLALKGSPCQVFQEGMKLQIADDTVLYPDLFVTNDKGDLATEAIFRAPTLVIEVLSPSTQGCDRSQKFALYRRLDSLKEYLLVDPDTRRVEAFRRNPDGDWVLHDMSESDTLHAASLDVRVNMAEVFAGIRRPAKAATLEPLRHRYPPAPAPAHGVARRPPGPLRAAARRPRSETAAPSCARTASTCSSTPQTTCDSMVRKGAFRTSLQWPTIGSQTWRGSTGSRGEAPPP